MVSVRAPTLKEALRLVRPKVLRWPDDRSVGILLSVSWHYVKQEELFSEDLPEVP